MQIRFKNWASIWDRSFQLTENKYFEAQLMWDTRRWFVLEIDVWTWTGMDHAGPKVNIALLGLELALMIYDRRHWDDDTNDWQYYPELDRNYDSRELSAKIYNGDLGFPENEPK